MDSAQTTIDELIENFSFLDDWEDRYRYVIELGKTLRRSRLPSITTSTGAGAAQARCGGERAGKRRWAADRLPARQRTLTSCVG